MFCKYYFESEIIQSIFAAYHAELRKLESLKDKPDSYLNLLIHTPSYSSFHLIITSHMNNDDLSNEQIADYVTNIISALISGKDFIPPEIRKDIIV